MVPNVPIPFPFFVLASQEVGRIGSRSIIEVYAETDDDTAMSREDCTHPSNIPTHSPPRMPNSDPHIVTIDRCSGEGEGYAPCLRLVREQRKEVASNENCAIFVFVSRVFVCYDFCFWNEGQLNAIDWWLDGNVTATSVLSRSLSRTPSSLLHCAPYVLLTG